MGVCRTTGAKEEASHSSLTPPTHTSIWYAARRDHRLLGEFPDNLAIALGAGAQKDEQKNPHTRTHADLLAVAFLAGWLDYCEGTQGVLCGFGFGW